MLLQPFFFFQAEDGIRDADVTGVQTCALPIYPTGSYVAEFGLPWRRVAAAAIDWTLCYVGFVLVSIPLGAVEGLGAVSREEGDLGGVPGHVLVVVTQVLTVVPVIAYFGLLCRRATPTGCARWVCASSP